MLTFPNSLSHPPHQITQVLHQLIQIEQAAKSDRLQFMENYPTSEDGFSMIEELELLTIAIRGYATQIQAKGAVKNTQAAIVDLRKLNVFDNPVISQFYQTSGTDYPNLQAYIQLLDYLRLLSLEYLHANEPEYSIPA